MIPFTPSQAATFAALAAVAQGLVLELTGDKQVAGLSSRQSAIQFTGTAEGCYSSAPEGLHSGGSYTWQSSGWCGKKCAEMGYPVMALQDSNCFCGEKLPATSASASDASCSFTCPGYDQEPCGGPKAYTVWLTGVPGDVTPDGTSDLNHKPKSSPGTPTPSTTAPTTAPTHSSHTHTAQSKKSKTDQSNQHTSHHTTHTDPPKTYTITRHQKTVTVHGSPTDSPNSKSDSAPHVSSESSSSSGSTIAIVVGIVAGVVVFAALVALVIFYLRRRRRMKNAENGHRRADSLNAFVASGGHMPGSVADRVPEKNVDDNRLDPSIMRESRRESVGSFLADNQDYSRRILTVTNPDGT